jgi:hypothetical protein
MMVRPKSSHKPHCFHLQWNRTIEGLHVFLHCSPLVGRVYPNAVMNAVVASCEMLVKYEKYIGRRSGTRCQAVVTTNRLCRDSSQRICTAWSSAPSHLSGRQDSPKRPLIDTESCPGALDYTRAAPGRARCGRVHGLAQMIWLSC